MASSIIHLAVAKKVNDTVQVERPKDYYLGSIAPDISKQIGDSKEESHFLINSVNNNPNLNVFKKRYPHFKDNSFELGYFTHLYTDIAWKEKFMPKFVKEGKVFLQDGTLISTNPEEITDLIYSDYTSLNAQVIDAYQLDLSIFEEEFERPETTMTEVPVDSLDILINKLELIIENSKTEKVYSFDMTLITEFIDQTAEEILEEIKDLEIL